MSEAELAGALPSSPSLQSLRDEGAERFDPARFRYLEVLSQRLPAASGEVKRILERKLQAALADYRQRFGQAQQAAGVDVARLSAQRPELARELRRLLQAGDLPGLRRLEAQAASSRPASKLAELNRHIRQATSTGEGEAAAELKSVQRFREVWSRIVAVDQVEQALARGPENAGPLNSHTLVLRSLALMRELSPDYLRRFMAHAEGLLWLDEESQRQAPVPPRPVRRSRAKKAG